MSTTEHRWAIRVAPNYSWFESMVEHMNSVDIGFLTDTYDAQPNQYALLSHHLDELDDPQEVADRAAALKALLDGSLYIQRGDYAGLHTEALIDLRTGAQHGIIQGNVLADPFSPTWLNTTVPRAYGDLSTPTERMIYMARDDVITRGMLSFLGVNGPTWITLYALRDYMKKGGWKDAAIAAAAGTTPNEVNRFTHTANNPAAVGPFARHGDQGHPLPKRVMTLDEAKQLMLSAAGKFLDERARELGIYQTYALNRSR
jgi:hypothetical protein